MTPPLVGGDPCAGETNPAASACNSRRRVNVPRSYAERSSLMWSIMTGSHLALRSRLGDTRLDESPNESYRQRLRKWKSNRSFRGLISLQRRGVRAPDRVGHRIEARVMFKSGIPDERTSIQSEAGNTIAESIDRLGSRGADD